MFGGETRARERIRRKAGKERKKKRSGSVFGCLPCFGCFLPQVTDHPSIAPSLGSSILFLTKDHLRVAPASLWRFCLRRKSQTPGDSLHLLDTCRHLLPPASTCQHLSTHNHSTSLSLHLHLLCRLISPTSRQQLELLTFQPHHRHSVVSYNSCLSFSIFCRSGILTSTWCYIDLHPIKVLTRGY